MTEAGNRPLGGLAGCIARGALGRVVGAGGLVLPPNRRGAFVAQRARGVGQKKTAVDVDGDSLKVATKLRTLADSIADTQPAAAPINASLR